MQESIGLLEVTNLTTALICIDGMIKSAYVEVCKTHCIGSGLITIVIKGELASVKEASEIGEALAIQSGGLLASKVIARPYVDLQLTLPKKEGTQDETI